MKVSLLICGGVGAACGTIVHLYRFVTEFRHLNEASEIGILTSSTRALLFLLLLGSFGLLFVGMCLRANGFGMVLLSLIFLPSIVSLKKQRQPSA